MNVIITGATGMVGEGVTHVCLSHPAIERILLINRKPSGINHPKVTEIIHADFFDLSAIEAQLLGYDACFFCLGVSSVGMSEADYFKMSHTLTLHVAATLSRFSPEMVFSYVSGRGTDSSEQGKTMWARVKGKTENDLMKLPFKKVFALRPAFIKPIAGLQRINKYYKYIGWMYSIGRRLSPKGFCTLNELALTFIYTAQHPELPSVVEGLDIIDYAQKSMV